MGLPEQPSSLRNGEMQVKKTVEKFAPEAGETVQG